MSVKAHPILLASLAALLGACAGLWDMTDGTLAGTLAILTISAFALSMVTPRWTVVIVLGLASGVLVANLAGWPPPGTQLREIDRSLIAAAVAALPAALGGLLGLGTALAAKWLAR
jgi:hypothetical protein